MRSLNKTDIKFTGMFGVTAFISIALVAASLFLIFSKMKYGVDFRGGAEVQVKFSNSIKVKDIRASLANAGFDSASVQTIGEAKDNEILIKVQAKETSSTKLKQRLKKIWKKLLEKRMLRFERLILLGRKLGQS